MKPFKNIRLSYLEGLDLGEPPTDASGWVLLKAFGDDKWLPAAEPIVSNGASYNTPIIKSKRWAMANSGSSVIVTVSDGFCSPDYSLEFWWNQEKGIVMFMGTTEYRKYVKTPENLNKVLAWIARAADSKKEQSITYQEIFAGAS